MRRGSSNTAAGSPSTRLSLLDGYTNAFLTALRAVLPSSEGTAASARSGGLKFPLSPSLSLPLPHAPCFGSRMLFIL